MFKPKLLQKEQGFTLVEVLVAIVVAIMFVATTMEMMVIATASKARAHQITEAINWIQKDIENVKYTASNFRYTSLKVAVNDTSTVLQVNSVDGFQDSNGGFHTGDTLLVGTDSTDNTVQSIDSATKTITLSKQLGTSWPIDIVVAATTKCNPPSGTPNAGFAKYLWDNLPTISDSGERIITGKRYILTRILTVRNVEPYAVLQLTYTVAPQNAHTTLTNAASTTSTTLNVASASGFKAGDKLTVGTSVNNEVQSISGNTITLKNQLGSEQSIGAVVDASIAIVNTEVIPNAALQCPS